MSLRLQTRQFFPACEVVIVVLEFLNLNLPGRKFLAATSTFPTSVLAVTSHSSNHGRDLKQIARQRVFGPNFHLYFNPSQSPTSPPLDSIIPTQVKTRKCL